MGEYVHGVQLLATQKPINRPGWWKGTFALFQILATGGWGWQTSVQRPTPPQKAGGESFYRQSGGGRVHAETAQLSLTIIFKLVISGLTSTILIVLGTVNLHFQGPFVPISLQSILRIVAAHVPGTI